VQDFFVANVSLAHLPHLPIEGLVSGLIDLLALLDQLDCLTEGLGVERFLGRDCSRRWLRGRLLCGRWLCSDWLLLLLLKGGFLSFEVEPVDPGILVPDIGAIGN
jgi:hypothetical protein